MNQISKFNFVVAASVIILLSNWAVCHENVANVNRMRQLTDNESVQSQQSNIDQRNVNAFKDRFNSDKIVFDRGDMYGTINTERIGVPSMTISNSVHKSNETNHQYLGKENGEYEFSLSIRSGVRRIESGDFEVHNGERVFVVRGFFEHINKDGVVKVTAYAFDHTGYHEIEVKTDSEGVIDLYGPDQAHDCDFSKGVYCIDRKLLSLMVG